MDYEKICRTCMANSDALFDLFDVNKNKKPVEIPIIEKLRCCSDIEIIQSDTFPKKICISCHFTLNAAYQFRIQCRKSDKEFRKIHRDQSIPDNQTDDKNDIADEISYLTNLDVKADDKYRQRKTDQSENVDESSEVKDKVLERNDTSLFSFDVKAVEKSESSNDQALFKVEKCGSRKAVKRKKTSSGDWLKEDLRLEISKLEFNDSSEDSSLYFDDSTDYLDDLSTNNDECGKEKRKSDRGKEESDFADIGSDGEIEKKWDTIAKRTRTKKNEENAKAGKAGSKKSAGAQPKPRAKRSELRKLKCKVCLMRFESKVEHVQHMETHKGERSFICEICGAGFLCNTTRYSHRKSHFPPRYHCDQCPYASVHKNDLVKHMRIHTGVKPYHCEYCSQTFTFQSNMVKHVKRHQSNEKSFRCHICPKAYYDKVSLQEHLDWHKGIKRHSCSICGMQYVDRSHWIRHLLKVHGVKVPRTRAGRRKTNIVVADSTYVEGDGKDGEQDSQGHAKGIDTQTDVANLAVGFE